MANHHRVSAVQEDYLEAILDLMNTGGVARAGEIARILSVHKSTVTAALRMLAAKGLVRYAPYEVASLSPAGREIAEEVCRRHRFIEDFLSRVLLLRPDAARRNACRIEHVVDRELLDRLAAFAQFLQDNPSAERQWSAHFASRLKHPRREAP